MEPGGGCLIQTTGATTVEIGNSANVSAGNGLQIAQGQSFSESDSADTHQWFAVVGSGSSTVVVYQ